MIGGSVTGQETATHTTTLTLSGSNNGSVTGIIADGSGGGNLKVNMSGTGIWTLSGANTYSGGTTLSSGTLALGSDSVGAVTSGPVGTGTLTLTGGTLQASGGDRSISNAVAINSGAGPTPTSVTGSNSLSLTGAFTVTSNDSTVINNLDTGKTLTLAGNVFLSNTSGTGHRLTIDGPGSTSISGVIANFSGGAGANGQLTKSGSDTLTLSNSNTYTGTTTISTNVGTLNAGAAGALGGTFGVTVNSGGTLLLSNSGTNDRIKNTATMTLSGGTFNTAGLSEHGASNNTAGIGAVTLSANSVLDLATGASIIAFANSSTSTWTAATTLSIYNWSGTLVTGGGTDQVYFGNDATGLTSTQLAQIEFFSGSGTGDLGTATILSNGEIVPVPEPSTWVAGLLTLAAVGYTQRRRLAEILKS